MITKTKFMCRSLMALCFTQSCVLCIADTKHKPSISMSRYLMRIGAEVDCYFTIERHQRDGYGFPVVEIPDDPSVHSVKALIEKFRRDTPNIEATQDTDNPAIVHIRFRVSKNVEQETLDARATLRFKGPIRDLANDLGKSAGKPIGKAKFVDIPIVTPDDIHTITQVTADDKPIRSILSDYAPLSRYASFIWLAFDREINQSYFMQIYYYGENDSYTLNPYTGEPISKDQIFPFIEGRNAYFYNPLSDKLTDEAVKFITDGFSSGKTTNVRWSMYYLGKHKMERAIPLLLEHLDYRYTTVPVLAEAYPAVHALLDMGTPATAFVQTQLTTETDPLRLQLLCAILLGVNGAENGRKMATETASKLPDAQAKRIATALQWAQEQIIAVPPPVDFIKYDPPKDFVPTPGYLLPSDILSR